jgi:phage-related protein
LKPKPKPKPKPKLKFHVASGVQIKAPPLTKEARRNAGYILDQVQTGDDPDPSVCDNYKPYPNVGPGCFQITLDNWRIIYWRAQVALYVLSVFKKTGQATPDRIKNVCKDRLRECKQHHRDNYE